jgi:DNA mismatch endonuclease (patch repair protein)
MRAVKAKDTTPEMQVRRFVHSLGFRYRLHRKDLPGKPDLVFAKLKSVIFVNGCFWHGHSCKRGCRVPKTNRSYWVKKIAGNAERDAANLRDLKPLGWRSLIVWECELTGKRKRTESLIRNFLNCRG